MAEPTKADACAAAIAAIATGQRQLLAAMIAAVNASNQTRSCTPATPLISAQWAQQ
jgi:hypothetical protein